VLTKVLRWLAATVASVALVGCSGSSPATTGQNLAGPAATPVDVGTTAVTVSKPIRLAVALPGTNNSYLQTQIRTVKEEIAKIPGASVTVFDGKFTPMTQFNELQNIIQAGKYNAIFLPSLDSNLNCKLVTEDAPRRGIVVVALITALCGRTVNEGEGLWAPGTLTYIGGVDTTEYWYQYLKYIVAKNPGPQKVLILAGPQNIGITINLEAALKRIKAEHPEFEVVQTAHTDYSIPQGNAKTMPMLQAHPDATILLSAYVTLTQGATQAIAAAGRTGTISVYDKGTSTWSLQQLRSGAIKASSPEYPATTIKTAVRALADAFDGKKVPRFFLNCGAPLPPDADPKSGFFLVTRENVDTFSAES
jgi:ribose transport system substrate-binding protein